MPGVSVIVPWAGDCPYRTAAWSHVHAWYAQRHPSWEVVRGFSRTGDYWKKAEAVADALTRADGEILIIADADVIAPQVGRAVQEVSEGASWTMPHHLLYRLTKEATARVLKGSDPGEEASDRSSLAQPPYRGYEGGGITVMRREVYEAVPLDPRFQGWGQEDEAWALALNLMYGEVGWRGTGPMWHLWHPPQKRISRSTGSHSSRVLLEQYKRVHSHSGLKRFLGPARELLKKQLVPTP